MMRAMLAALGSGGRYVPFRSCRSPELTRRDRRSRPHTFTRTVMPHSPRRACAAVALCAGAIVGCHSDKHTAPAPTGSLTVDVTTSGDGALGAVVISGPNGYSKTIASTQTLTGLTLGSYTVVADSSTAPDSIIGTVIDTGTVTGSPATVTAGTAATASVTYSEKGHVGGLWVANNSTLTIPEYSSNQLTVTASLAPADTLSTMNGSAGLALDPNGNMWESSFLTDTLKMYSLAARNAGGAPSPTAILTSSALNHPENLAFDAQGNLWVANRAGHNIIEFTASQIAGAGAQTPTVVIGAGGTNAPYGVTFDGSGNLWVAYLLGSPQLVEFPASQIASSGSPVPTVSITGASVMHPDGIAFDASGNLWASNNSGTVVEFTPTQLAATGSPAATTTITMPSGSFPFGIAFDNRGSLWVSDDQNGIMYALSSAQLAAGGTPTPAVALTVTNLTFAPEQPMFDPSATALGLSASAVRMSPRSTTRAHSQNLNAVASRN
jgi:streptogramin lyase